MLCLIEINSMKIELTAHTSYYCVLDLLSVKLTFNNNDNIDNIVAVFNHGKITLILMTMILSLRLLLNVFVILWLCFI